MTSKHPPEPESPPAANNAPDRREARGKGGSFPIAGIGASAGGLEAFTELLKHLPTDTGMGFVLVQHLDPQHDSALTEILSRATSLPVRDITDTLRVEPNHVYVITPNTSLGIAEGILKVQPRPRTRLPHRPIDAFFKALAQDQRERAIGVVLSGTASDGTLGLEAIKAADGITFAQDDSAKHDSMPRSAVAAGCVDFVLSPAQIAQKFARIAAHPYIAGQPTEVFTAAEDDAAAGSKRKENAYQKILLLLRNHSGVDFSLYKSSTIQRRVNRRLVLSKASTLEDYAGFLRGNAKELGALYSDVLISVTSFFRNPEAFDALQRQVLPKLLKQPGDDPLRAWVLGCSAGQEAYSLAIAFAEAAEKAPRLRKLQVFATDLNDALLDKARHGLYAKSLAEDITPQRLRRFFVEEEGGYRISKALREMVVFARQNLISDPPFSRMDLISCRNLLIYLEPSLQQKAIPTFHYALKPAGYLFLGASESIGEFTDLFEPVDKKHKIYAKKAAPSTAFHLPLHKKRDERSLPPLPVARGEAAEGLRGELNAQREADRIVVNRFAPPGVLINDQLQVLQFRGPTDRYLAPPSGKASFDLLKMAREGLMLPLRAAINQAKRDRRAARKENVRVEVNGETRTVSVEVIPLKNQRERCFLILFEEADAGRRSTVPRPPQTHRLPGDEASRRIAELKTELAETHDYLQSMQEQQDAANEELQAANEETESANEELQSLNEELETSKEELESTNEELVTVNEEMVNRNTELNRLNNDLVNLQNSTRLAIVLLGRDLTIRRFSVQAEKQLELRAADLGRPIGHVRHNLVLEPASEEASPLDLERLVDEVITRVREDVREVRDKAGRWYSLQLRPYMTLDNKVDGAVLVLSNVDALKRSEQAIAAARDYAENVVETVREPLLVLDDRLRVESANHAFYRAFGVGPAETLGERVFNLGNRQWDIPRLRELLEEILPQNISMEDFQVEHDFERLDQRIMLLSARRILDPQRKSERILLVIEDITERKRAEEANVRLAAIIESSDDAIISKDLEGVIQTWNAGAQRLFGYTAQEVIGQPIAMLIPPDRIDEEPDILARIRRGERVAHYETVRRRKDGAPVDIALSISPIFDALGRVLGASKIARDITERKRMERQIQEQAKDLIDMNHRKDEFLAMLSHELRNPLTPIANAVQLLLLQKNEDALQQQACTIIERQVGQLKALIDDLLEVSRITSGRIKLQQEKVDVRDIVERSVEAVRSLLNQCQHELTVSLPPRAIWLYADPARIQQVAINLLNNAIKYTDEGGHIWLALQQEDDEAVLRVRDTGIGIAPELLPRIFDLFAQSEQPLDRSQGGLGIGLSLVQRLVELHGGAVTVDSTVGHGSEFVVRLPIVLALMPPSPPPSPSTEEAAPPDASLRVLVVDDNVDTARISALLLKQVGHEVRTAHDGLTALEAALDYQPDVVLLDIGLPGLDGFEVAKRLRQQSVFENIVLVALTGYGQEEDRRRSQEAGFDHHLVKPFDFKKVQEILATVLIKAT